MSTIAIGDIRGNLAALTDLLDRIAHGVLTAVRLPDRRVFQSRRYDVVLMPETAPD